jgi:acetyl esterase/lipase
MSILSVPVVADLAARALKQVAERSARLRPADALRFDEIDASTTPLRLPTRHGDVRATAYHPPDRGPDRGVYVNFHGGGFVLGNYEQDDPWCRYLAAHAQVTVLNVDYALAPAHRFPVPIEQAYDVLRWAADDERAWDGIRLCVGAKAPAAPSPRAPHGSRVTWAHHGCGCRSSTTRRWIW